MSIAADKLDLIEAVSSHVMRLTDTEIERLIDKGDILERSEFSPRKEMPFGEFYAPFDWINDEADIVLIGITPGRHQATEALKTLRAELRKGSTHVDAAKAAKQAASFDGDMREIAAGLMDRFQLQKLFGLKSCADLFGNARHRAHYTSILRYPVLHWQTKKKKGKPPVTGWFDYSGGDKAFKSDLLVRSLQRDFKPEIQMFKNAWLVPFGPTLALALEKMAARGLIDGNRILPGMNHPSATQRNRHNCQLNTTDDHSKCASNVGCGTVQGRSHRLEETVAERLSHQLSLGAFATLPLS